jgi:hypothetical protein
MSEDRLYRLSRLIKDLKIAIYSLVNEYRRLIHMSCSSNKDFTKMCRASHGQIDEKGSIYVTKNMLENFAERFKNKCLEEASYWAKFIPILDIFVQNMLNFEDPIVLLKTKNEQLRYIYECWFGDVYKVNFEQGIIMFKNEIEKKKKNINLELFKSLSEVEEETLLQGLPL